VAWFVLFLCVLHIAERTHTHALRKKKLFKGEKKKISYMVMVSVSNERTKFNLTFFFGGVVQFAVCSDVAIY